MIDGQGFLHEAGINQMTPEKNTNKLLAVFDSSISFAGNLVLEDLRKNFHNNPSLESITVEKNSSNSAVAKLGALFGEKTQNIPNQVINRIRENPKVIESFIRLQEVFDLTVRNLAANTGYSLRELRANPKLLFSLLNFGAREMQASALAMTIAPQLIGELNGDGKMSKMVGSPPSIETLVATLIMVGILRRKKSKDRSSGDQDQFRTLSLDQESGAGKKREVVGRRDGRDTNRERNVKIALVAVIGVVVLAGCCSYLTTLPKQVEKATADAKLTPTIGATAVPTLTEKQKGEANYDSYVHGGIGLNPVTMISVARTIELTRNIGPTWAFVPERRQFLESVFGRGFTDQQILEIKNNPQLFIDMLQSMSAKPGLSQNDIQEINNAIDFYKLRINDPDGFNRKYGAKPFSLSQLEMKRRQETYSQKVNSKARSYEYSRLRRG